MAQVERKAVAGLLGLVKREREGEAVNRALLSHLLRMMLALGTYQEAFQGPFLEETVAFYRAEAAQLMAETDVADYLVHCEVRHARQTDPQSACRASCCKSCQWAWLCDVLVTGCKGASRTGRTGGVGARLRRIAPGCPSCLSVCPEVEPSISVIEPWVQDKKSFEHSRQGWFAFLHFPFWLKRNMVLGRN
jgi:Cullin family